MLRILHDTRIDFVRLWKLTTAIIFAFIIPGFIWILATGFNWGIEFTGGTLVELHFAKAPNVEDVRSTVRQAGFPDAEVQTFGAPNQLVVRAQDEQTVQAQASGAEGVAERIGTALDARFGADGYTEVRSELIGPRVGQELRQKALIALLISFGVSLVYLAWRFDWRLGVAAIIGNVHDILATLAFIKYMGIEVNLFIVGAVLTVIGYSLSDTVVVFDRVRELLRFGERRALRDTLNLAVNETLPRTVMTGTTVLACLLSLILLGGSVLRPFALVLFFGIVVGTFSSIYVAGPVLLAIENRWPRSAPTAGPRRGADQARRAPAKADAVTAR